MPTLLRLADVPVPDGVGGGDDFAGELARHRELLVAELADREEGFVADGSLVPGRPVQSEAAWVREFAQL